jgi:hypothetical protein
MNAYEKAALGGAVLFVRRAVSEDRPHEAFLANDIEAVG